ncbi:MAG: hypothetical protein KDA20_02110 [Phycisphaerales bacterium]|nr:hypothetical protein [Phycisphaerales bacterium]
MSPATTPIDPTLGPPASVRTVRLGAVRYLNTVPLIAGLEKAIGLEIRLEAPARLIELLAPIQPGQAPQVDLALCSIIDYQRSAVPLEIAPVGVIACDGPTRTVRVFSRVPLEQVTVLHADVESHTSVALASVVFAEQFGRRLAIKPFAHVDRPHDAWPDAVLLIGDKTITHAPPKSSHPYTLDLSTAWRAITGLPFVYAAWMCRAGEFDARPELRTMASLLDRQRRRNCVRVGWSAAQSAATHGWTPDAAQDYVANELRYNMDGEARQAVGRFFECAANAGAIAQVKPIHWAGEAELGNAT